MRNKIQSNVKPSEITRKQDYLNRRQFLQAAGIAGSALATSTFAAELPAQAGSKLDGVVKSQYSTDEAQNSYEDVTTYNNFYEFGMGKADPARNAGSLKTRPWSIEVSGHAEVTGSFDLEDFVKPHTLEERIYRLRCVEAWSMVIPWVGIPLADVLSQFKPLSNAKFVEFKTLHDPEQMPGQRSRTLRWPYVEGLTIEEAMHPLSILAVGVYGEVLPNQNGAPMRLVVPWKYGFKSIKSINQIRFTEDRPKSSWELAAPREYGFYANVNPEVDHPRWSQATERRIGATGTGFRSLFNTARQDTLPFNGYAEEVAHLYDGIDLRRNF